MGIESSEGHRQTIKPEIDLDFGELTEEQSKCGWCEESSFAEFYEIL